MQTEIRTAPALKVNVTQHHNRKTQEKQPHKTKQKKEKKEKKKKKN